MKTLTHSKFLLTLVAVVTLSSFSAEAGSRRKSEQAKVVSMAREAVSKAAATDWYTLAASASAMINEGVNICEAKAWIEKSREIKETAYNLEVQAEYYKATKETEKAAEYYLKSMAKLYLE